MRKGVTNIFFPYMLILLLQIIVTGAFDVSPMLIISVLPALIVCLPNRYPTIVAMLIAFATGLAVDVFAEGTLGLTAAALLPVAFVRKTLVKLLFGEDLYARGEEISMAQHGVAKVFTMLAVSLFIYLFIYIWADGAGMRTFGFNALRMLYSFILSIILCFIASTSMISDRR